MQKKQNNKSQFKDWIKNLRVYSEYSFVRKCMSIIRSTKIGRIIILGLMKMFPDIEKSPNKISWMFNRFRNPDQYRKFADERKWVFIIGCTNSGTTLLHALLATHPDIASLHIEGQYLTQVLPTDSKDGLQRVWTENLKIFRNTEADQHIDAIRLIHDWKNYLNNVNASTVLEKTPINSIRSRWLQSVFKNSYFIGIVRDGRAVSEGIARRTKSVSIERAADHWIMTYNLMLDDAKYLKHFNLVKYENLVANSFETVMEVLDFIEEDPKKFQFDVNSVVDIHNIDDVPTAITNFNQKSFDRIPEDIFDKITMQIQPTMKRLGYLN
ncbi:MAG: sulfotransferase family protein [Nitrospinales bacterium]